MKQKDEAKMAQTLKHQFWPKSVWRKSDTTSHPRSGWVRDAACGWNYEHNEFTTFVVSDEPEFRHGTIRIPLRKDRPMLRTIESISVTMPLLKPARRASTVDKVVSVLRKSEACATPCVSRSQPKKSVVLVPKTQPTIAECHLIHSDPGQNLAHDALCGECRRHV